MSDIAQSIAQAQGFLAVAIVALLTIAVIDASSL